jgi:hypothetical protein
MDAIGPIRKSSVPLWEHFICAAALAMRGAMKLMGTCWLGGLAAAAAGASARALRAELACGEWRSAEAVRASYPAAAVEADRFVIALDADHCAEVVFGYEVGIALVTFAGRCVDRPCPAIRKGKRS